MEPGDERDARARQLNRFADRLAALPGRVADRAAMLPRDQVAIILEQECSHVCDALTSFDG